MPGHRYRLGGRMSRAQVHSLMGRLRRAIEKGMTPEMWGGRLGLDAEDLDRVLRLYRRKYGTDR